MRCLALAQAWQDWGGSCAFATAECTPAVKERLHHENIQTHSLPVEPGNSQDASQTSKLAGEVNAAWIVIDGYSFGSQYQCELKAGGKKLLVVDDHGCASPYSADLVLNHSLQAAPEMYANRAAGTRLLLGPRYAMLRREFRAWRSWERNIPQAARKLLVTMGGSDPANITCNVIAAIRQLAGRDLETVVLIGGSNPHRTEIEAAAREAANLRVVCDTNSMADLIAWADAAVAGAGTTFWEMAFLGLPAILLVLAENQTCVAQGAETANAAWNLGDAAAVSVETIAARLNAMLDSPQTRGELSANARALVDGRGADRVVAFLSGLELRKATAADCELFWQWANDPATRSASFHGDPILWDDHRQWFNARLNDPQSVVYVAANGSGAPLGSVRFQIENERAVLSIVVGSQFRGGGWGQKLLALAAQRLFEDYRVNLIDAFVKPANAPSMKLFSAAGFERMPNTVVHEQEAARFRSKRKIKDRA